MTHVLAFLKAPRTGFVKTRLAQSLGDEAALAAYKALVERQMGALPSDVKVEIHFTPTHAEAEMRQWLGATYNYHAQVEGGLGERLQSAVARAFRAGASNVVCIGGDCPGLNAAHFTQCRELLEKEHDLVFGPSEDGGYYLIGMSRPIPEIFEGIPWSEPNTLDSSLAKARQLGLRVERLETLYDVDEANDLERAVKDGRIRLH